MAQNLVTKCICHDRSFEEVKDYAEEHELCTVKELREHDFCSTSCGLCTPYIEIVLETDQTQFTPGEPYRRK
ncbi:hypothetical protein [Fodinibius halophilus]|uniref:(2Fe-2S)-binding protein n=1 Tax=Fodinibius halophilus TaxID=1736908 RepID=A0A6M1SXD0_9BACT|nr:hypothetical protein [Fodinibius halophilus]NGP88558.1 hypothetical protein [Fodinibius halophilus]